MKLSLQDQVALIYSSQGSQRATAALLGVSHQKVGRILRAGSEGGYKADGPAMSDPGLSRAVHVAFEIHKGITRGQARADGLPYSADVPVFIQRMEYTPWEWKPTGYEIFKGGKWQPEYKKGPKLDAHGRPVVIRGDRVAAQNVHWLSDKLRNRWITTMQRTGKFDNASVGSIVDLVLYSRQADLREAAQSFDEVKSAHAQTILATIERNIVNARVFTKYTPMHPGLNERAVIADITNKLRQKHEPATGSRGTRLADEILLQVNTKNGQAQDFRNRHPIPPKRRKIARGKESGSRS